MVDSVKRTVIFLVGPTAVGKTEVSVSLAKIINAEIISSDSMQVYRGMDIGTSKPSHYSRDEAPHHLIDILNPSDNYNAAEFRQSALKIIEEIHGRNRVPLVVGGTGLYVRALLDGLFPGASADWNIRGRLIDEMAVHGKEYIYKRLEAVDPDTAGKIHPNDSRRVIRALEVYEKKEIPISKLRTQTCGIEKLYNVKIFGLVRQRQELYKRIDDRVEKMFNEGFIDEVKGLLSKCSLSQTASQALGYKEVIGYLNNSYDFNELNRLVKRNTRRYAKRQLTWFRKDKRIEWIEIGEEESSGQVAERICFALKV